MRLYIDLEVRFEDVIFKCLNSVAQVGQQVSILSFVTLQRVQQLPVHQEVKLASLLEDSIHLGDVNDLLVQTCTDANL